MELGNFEKKIATLVQDLALEGCFETSCTVGEESQRLCEE